MASGVDVAFVDEPAASDAGLNGQGEAAIRGVGDGDFEAEVALSFGGYR
jgi:hypothetical protein